MANRFESFKSLILSLFFTLIFCVLGYITLDEAMNAYLLSAKGKPTIASVVDYEKKTRVRRRRTRTYHYHTLKYIGHEKRIDLGRHYPIGTRFHAVYLPSNPEIMILGTKNDSFLNLYKNENGYGWWGVIVSIVFPLLGLFFAYVSIRWLKFFITGTSPDEVDETDEQ